ncbi:MAG TPA: XRE family transcriptional regulator [bacterium]|nr:XRE family transcriptional regulator [bacterium]
MIYEQIEKIRLKNSLSIKDFSKLIGISFQAYYMYNGHRNISKPVAKIVKMIEMQPDVILFLLAKINDNKQVKYKYADEILVELIKMT